MQRAALGVRTLNSTLSLAQAGRPLIVTQGSQVGRRAATDRLMPAAPLTIAASGLVRKWRCSHLYASVCVLNEMYGNLLAISALASPVLLSDHIMVWQLTMDLPFPTRPLLLSLSHYSLPILAGPFWNPTNLISHHHSKNFREPIV